jgi:hypothetical protein
MLGMIGCNADETTGTIPSVDTNFKDFSGIPPIPTGLSPLYHTRAGDLRLYFYVAGDCQDTVIPAIDAMPVASTTAEFPFITYHQFPTRQWHLLSMTPGRHLLSVNGKRIDWDSAGKALDIWDTGQREWQRNDTLVFRCP